MKKILAAIETAIGACINQLIKLKEWLKRVRDDTLSKLVIKISSFIPEEYSQQLIEIEKGIKELRGSFPSEEEREKIANLAKTARAIPKKNLRDFSKFINKISSEDIEKITALAEATKDFKRENAKSISKFVKKFRKEELEKLEKIKKMRAMGLINISDEELKSVKMILDYINIIVKEDLEKYLTPIKTAKLCQDVDLIKGVEKGIELLKLEHLSEDQRKELEMDIHIINWFLKSKKMNIEVEGLEFKKIEEKEEKEMMNRKITLMEEEEIDVLTTLNVRSLFYIGRELLKRGKFKKACENFDYITKINENIKGAWLNKGIALGNMAKYEKEIQCYDKALEISKNKEYARAWYNKGVVLKRIKKDEEAEKCFKKAEEINPEFSSLIQIFKEHNVV